VLVEPGGRMPRPGAGIRVRVMVLVPISAHPCEGVGGRGAVLGSLLHWQPG